MGGESVHLFFEFTIIYGISDFGIIVGAINLTDKLLSKWRIFMNITLRKLSFLLCFLCFAGNALAQSHVTSANDLYTFETIAVEGVDYLAVGASSDFEDYAGNTPSPDGERMIGFTLIDGVFKTYDFPGAKNVYFYALGNNGVAGGYYEDSDGLHHGHHCGKWGDETIRLSRCSRNIHFRL